MTNRKVRVTATVVYETELPDDEVAYPGTKSWLERLAMEKQLLEEDGSYLFEAIAGSHSDVTALITEVQS